MFKISKGWAVAGILALWMVVGALPANAEPDVLERPALRSERAVHSLILAVTRAGQRIIAVGERGIVLLSDDDGATWRQAAVPVTVTLTNVRFSSEQVGWVIGQSGVVLKTADGGQSWEKKLDGAGAAKLLLEAAKAHAAETPDDRRAQRQVADAERLVADGPDKPFFDLVFKNDREGFVIGAYGLILGTANGGVTWESWQDRLDNPKGLHLYAVDANDNATYIVGEQGALYVSRDGAKTFTAIKTPYQGTYFGVHSVKDGVLVFGLRGNAFWAKDNLQDWERVKTGDEETLNAATTLADGSLILVDQTGRILESDEGGGPFHTLPTAGLALPLTGAVQAADGSLVVCGMGGVTKLVAQSLFGKGPQQ